MLQSYLVTLGQQLAEVLVKMISFVPVLLFAVLTVVAGWVFGTILGRAVAHVFDILKIDRLFNGLGILHLSKKSGHDLTLGNVFGGLTKWSVIAAFFMGAANILGLRYVSVFLLQVVGYIPNVFVAGFILVITSIAANFTEKVIDGSVRSAGLRAGYAGTVAKYAIVVVGILSAISQLNLLGGFSNILFMGIVAAVALALGLAFGLGGKNAAERAIGKLENDFTKK